VNKATPVKKEPQTIIENAYFTQLPNGEVDAVYEINGVATTLVMAGPTAKA
jgi:hypothetical protein